jgi:hypothetical protein
MGDFAEAVELYGKTIDADSSMVEAVQGRQQARDADAKASQVQAIVLTRQFHAAGRC